MMTYPQTVNWPDGTRTAFASRKEHESALAHCAGRGHRLMPITISGESSHVGCVECLTSGQWDASANVAQYRTIIWSYYWTNAWGAN